MELIKYIVFIALIIISWFIYEVGNPEFERSFEEEHKNKMYIKTLCISRNAKLYMYFVLLLMSVDVILHIRYQMDLFIVLFCVLFAVNIIVKSKNVCIAFITIDSIVYKNRREMLNECNLVHMGQNPLDKRKIMYISVKGKTSVYKVRKVNSEFSSIDDICRMLFQIDEIDDKTEAFADSKRKLIVAVVLLGMVTSLAGISLFMSAENGAVSNDNVDYTKVYYDNSVKNNRPETAYRAEDGLVYALFENEGTVNVYDKDLKFRYAYKVPKGKQGGACSAAFDYPYVLIENCVYEVFVYKGKTFEKKITTEEAEKMYTLDYWSYGEREDLIERIGSDKNENSNIGFLLLVAGLLIMSAGIYFANIINE